VLSEAIDILKKEAHDLRVKDQVFTKNLREELSQLNSERNELHNSCVEKDVKIK
jgi:hypothetical protein